MGDNQRQPLMEDKFDGIRPSMVDFYRIFYGKHPWMEVNLLCKATFDGSQPLMEDNVRWKKFQWNMILDGRRASMEVYI